MDNIMNHRQNGLLTIVLINVQQKIQNNDSIAILISELKATFFIFATMSNCTVNKNNIYAN